MPKIQQVVYTSSIWNREHSGGYGVFSHSSGLSLEEAVHYVSAFHYKLPLDMSDTQEKYPLMTGFFPCPEQHCTLAGVCRYLGRRWYENRTGDYISHVLVFPEGVECLSPARLEAGGFFWKEVPRDLRERAIAFMQGEAGIPAEPDLLPELDVADLQKFVLDTETFLTQTMAEVSEGDFRFFWRKICRAEENGNFVFASEHPGMRGCMESFDSLLPMSLVTCQAYLSHCESVPRGRKLWFAGTRKGERPAGEEEKSPAFPLGIAMARLAENQEMQRLASVSPERYWQMLRLFVLQEESTVEVYCENLSQVKTMEENTRRMLLECLQNLPRGRAWESLTVLADTLQMGEFPSEAWTILANEDGKLQECYGKLEEQQKSRFVHLALKSLGDPQIVHQLLVGHTDDLWRLWEDEVQENGELCALLAGWLVQLLLERPGEYQERLADFEKQIGDLPEAQTVREIREITELVEQKTGDLSNLERIFGILLKMDKVGTERLKGWILKQYAHRRLSFENLRQLWENCASDSLKDFVQIIWEGNSDWGKCVLLDFLERYWPVWELAEEAECREFLKKLLQENSTFLTMAFQLFGDGEEKNAFLAHFSEPVEMPAAAPVKGFWSRLFGTLNGKGGQDRC